MVENKITVQRNASWHRPCNFQGKEIDSIVIYSKGEILYQTRSGWLEDDTKRADVSMFKINQPSKAIKLNLNREDNFFMTGRRQYRFDKAYTLYINADLEGIKVNEGDWELDWETAFEKRFVKYTTIKFSEPVLLYGKSEFVSSIKTRSDFKTEDKELRKKAEELGVKLEELGFKGISKYDLEQAIEKYEINIDVKERK